MTVAIKQCIRINRLGNTRQSETVRPWPYQILAKRCLTLANTKLSNGDAQ